MPLDNAHGLCYSSHVACVTFEQIPGLVVGEAGWTCVGAPLAQARMRTKASLALRVKDFRVFMGLLLLSVEKR